jgi:type I restriction enzyme, S subunit
MSLATPRKGYKSVPWLFGKAIEIPQEWELEQLGDISKIKGGKRLPKGEPFSKGKTNHPYLRVTDFGNNTIYEKNLEYVTDDIFKKIKNYTISSEDVYISIAGTIGLAGLIPKSLDGASLTENACKVIVTKNIVKEYLSIILNSKLIQDQIQSYLGVTSQPKLALFRIEKLEFPLPPLPEQQKIATILSNVDNLIESTEKVITHSKKVKTGLMQKLLTRGIGHTKFKKVQLLPKHIVVNIPVEWKTEIVKNILIEKIQNGINIKLENYGTGFPIFEIESLYKSDVIIEQSNLRLVSIENIKNYEQYKLKENDFVLNRVSKVKEGVGKCLLIKNPIENLLYEGNMIRIRIDQNCIYPMFLAFLTKSTLFFNYIQSTCKTTSLTSIDQGIIEKIPIILPPLPEQQKIASILSNMDSKITSQEQYREKLEKLKKSLMQKLLTGEVRV